MPSFTQTIVLSIAALAATASAGPIDRRDTNVCWGPNSKGTDKYYGPTPNRCLSVHYEDSFTAPFVVHKPGAPTFDITTEAHQTYGPMHCCNSCKASDNCIGWQIELNCDCVLFKINSTVGAGEVLGVWADGGPFKNKTGSFHRGPAFPVAPNLFGNDTFKVPQQL